MMTIDRRTLLRQGLLTAFFTAAPPWLFSTAMAQSPTGGRPFTVASQGGRYQKAFGAAFVSPIIGKHLLSLRFDTIDYTKLEAQVQSSKVEWDLCDVHEWFGYAGASKNLLEPIDYATINKALVPPGGAQSHAVQNAVLGRPIAYSTKAYSAAKHPRTWAEFWDVKAFPGKRGFWASPHSGLLEAALMADGVSPIRLYPLDLDRAFKSLDRIKPHLIPAKSQQALFQLFVDQQADLALAIEGRLNAAIDAGAPWAVEWDWALLQREFLVVPKGTPYKNVSFAIISYALGRAPQARYTHLTGYGPANRGAFELLDPKYLERFAYSPTHDPDKLVDQDGRWYAANIDLVTQRWQQWLAA